jgi:MFS family permease
VGAVFSATPLGYGIGTVLGGRLADRLPPRRLCWAALGMLATGFAVAFGSGSGATFVLFYAFLGLGLGGGLALVAGLAAGARVLPKRPGAVGGALTATYALGAVVQVPGVALLAGWLGWLNGLRLTGTVLVALAAAALALMPRLPPPLHAANPQGSGLAGIFLRRGVWTAYAIEACLTPLGTFAFVSLLLYAHVHGLAPVLGTAALVTLALGNTAGRVLGGVVSDRTGVNAVFAAILGFSLVAAGLMAWAPAQATLLPAAVLAGLGLGGGAGVMSRAAALAAPDAPGSAFGLIFAGFASGAFLGPLAGAVLGLDSEAWLIMGLLPLAGFGLLILRRAPPHAAGTAAS